jgi:hypothetical protein
MAALKKPRPFKPDVHRMQDVPALDYFKREYPKFADYLFTYLHLVTGNIILGGWTNKQRGMFIEITSLGPNGVPDAGSKEEARLTMKPTDEEVEALENLEKNRQLSHRGWRTEQQEEMDDLLDHKRFIYNRQKNKDPNAPFWRDVKGRRRYPGTQSLSKIRAARKRAKEARKARNDQ